MFRNALSFGGLLLLAGAVVVATPGLGLAQHGGGHGGGGGHFGGGHMGGSRFGGHGGDFRFDHPFARSGYPLYFGGYGYSDPFYYDGYGYSYPYPYYYGSYGYGSMSPTYDSGYSSYYGGVAPSYSNGLTSSVPSAYYTPVTPPDNTAHVSVRVPADAEVWVEGTKLTATGPVREIQSPALDSGTKYTYEIRARWSENGQEVNQTLKIGINAGSQSIVSFPVPSTTVGNTSSTVIR